MNFSTQQLNVLLMELLSLEENWTRMNAENADPFILHHFQVIVLR
jgi:hypothetical protein